MVSLLALAALALSAPQPAPVALDDLIAFADRARCQPAPTFDKILDELWTARSDSRAVLMTVPKPYRPAFGQPWGFVGNNGATYMSVAMHGTWHGLPIAGLVMNTKYGEPGIRLEIEIGASSDQTRAALYPLGFQLGASVPPVDPSVQEPRSTVLTCKLFGRAGGDGHRL